MSKCEKCEDSGEIEVVDDWFNYCDCIKGDIKKYADLTERKLRLKRNIKVINNTLAGLKVRLDS